MLSKEKEKILEPKKTLDIETAKEFSKINDRMIQKFIDDNRANKSQIPSCQKTLKNIQFARKLVDIPEKF